MNITEAHAVLREKAAEMTAALRAKGYEKAHVEIWIGRNEGVTLFVEDCPQIIHPSGSDLASAIKKFDEKFAKLPDAHAADCWFAGPLFLMSEQQQAAE